MQARAKQIKIRLFIEGIECPIISASIQSQPNAPATASIQVPPTALGTKLFPRTVVHVFFADFFEDGNPLVSFRGGDVSDPRKPQDPTAYEQAKQRRAKGTDDAESDTNFANDVRNIRYKLLFCGEIVGFQWMKTPTQRSLIFQCVDFSNYWDYAYQFNNTDLFGPGLKAVFSGGSTNLLTDFLSTPGEIVTSLLHQKSVNYPALEGFLGGLIRMLEGIGGSYYTDTKFQGQNIFYSLAELRLHITQMITVFPGDNTAQKLLGAGGYDSLFGRTLGNLGEQVSIRVVLNALTKLIFHETYPITTPLYVPGTQGSVGGQVRKLVKNVPAYYYVYSVATNNQRSIDDIKSILEQPGDATSSVAAPVGNPTKNKAALITRLAKMKKNLTAASLTSRQKGPAEATAIFSAAASQLAVATTKIQAAWRPGMPASPKRTAMLVELNKVRVLLQKAVVLEVNTIKKAVQQPARLNTQIFKPDIWFGPPPRCNVLFPENYAQLQYQRSYLQETTRLLLKTSGEFGEDELFDSFFFAPQARSIKGKKSTLQGLFANDIMDHELYTGILPKFEKMGEMNIFAVRSGTVDGKVPKISLSQRSVNFLFFKQKFASRQASVSGPFNPYLACGFPGLIIDKYVNMEQALQYQAMLRDVGGNRDARLKIAPDISNLLGTHFLGMFAEVSHQLEQMNGMTSVGIMFPREYAESTEFFGPSIKEDQIAQVRLGADSLRDTAVASLTKPPIGAVGPNFGIIKSVEDITSRFSAPSDKVPDNYAKLALWSGTRRSGTGQLDQFVPVGVEVKVGSLGTKVVDATGGDPDRLVTFRAWMIHEQVPKYRQEIIDEPAEALIRPGWYGDAWRNDRIGKAYNHYFNIGSITDTTQVADPAGLSTGSKFLNAEDKLAEEAGREDERRAKDIAPALFTLEKNQSIEQATEFILLTYSYIKQNKLNVDEFIRAYTWRPIATMVDMFGTSDLQLSADGTKAVSGIEGFHSRAFGPFADLFGLVTPEITEILGVKKTDIARANGDVRGRRFEAAGNFINALTFSKAQIGLASITVSGVVEVMDGPPERHGVSVLGRALEDCCGASGRPESHEGLADQVWSKAHQRGQNAVQGEGRDPLEGGRRLSWEPGIHGRRGPARVYREPRPFSTEQFRGTIP